MTITNATGRLVSKPEAQPGSYIPTCGASRHGTALAYQVDRCRCPDALADQRRYRKRLRLQHHRGAPPIVPAIGTLRRVRALQAIGWPRPEIMRRLGLRNSGTWLIYATHVNRTTAVAVAALYDELADTPGLSAWTATYARNHGWLPPLWWDADTIDDPEHTPPTREPARPRKTDVDPVRVDRAIAGQPVDLTRAERLDAVRQLRARHLGYDAIADRLRVAARQVHRDLADLGLVQTEAGAA